MDSVFFNVTSVSLLQTKTISTVANSYEINSISRAAEILKFLSLGVDKLTDLSRRLEVNKATVHRIMKTLEAKGLVSQDPATRRYYLGPRIQSLAENPLMVHKIVSQLSLPEMERLSDCFGETVVLQIRRGGQRIILEKVVGSQSIRYFPDSVETTPVYAGAGAKVLLAEMEQPELMRLLDRLEFTKIGPNTTIGKNKLIADLETIRSQGYASSIGETIEGGAGIAVPVRNYSCPVALVIVGPETRMIVNRADILEEMLKSAAIISEKISTITGIQSL